ncbi:COP-coated vesicle membrane protein erv25 precursor [Trypanosoma grayi]|uniref:COP-coated vesicle membrane protein erv25 precursor n=1 Tax=Trypanosoma grayi TaxID=71804 RepID=UPI0004F3F4A0|nr:COP-coated vesicle membrane protein erv25 precursor [Trypanosoma grayi]KEG07820.1 COP-coated vesicle membrane protein erv25 precursor [Trypanosoma grayi]
MRCSVPVLLLALLLVICCPAGAVRFLLKDTQPLCFVEEVDENTKIVSGEYTRAAAASDVPARIVVTAPGGIEVTSTDLLVGTHAFSAPVGRDNAGQYLLCVQVTDKGWKTATESNAIAVDFNADQSANVIPSTDGPIVKRQKVDGLEVFTFRDFGGEQKDVLRPADYIKRVEDALTTLSTLVAETRDEIDHLINRFTRMRRTSESTYTRIWAFGIITVLVMVIVTWLQFRFLKSALQHKKLV